MTSRLLLPVEIYDAIISLVTNKKDLLNLSLACRQLYKLIIPNHIDYRGVVCSAFDRFVWEHFLNNPHLAKRIHSIKILDDVKFQDGTETDAKMECRVIPRELQVLSTQELKSASQLNTFTKSILVMENLYSFDYRGPCPVSMLFTHLAHHATGLRIFKYNYERTKLHQASLWDDFIDSLSQVQGKGFKYLEDCFFSIHFCGGYGYDNHTNVLSMINNILKNNLSLKSVNLFFWVTYSEFIPLPRFLLDANWPKITALALEGEFTIFKDDIDPQLRVSQTQAFFIKHASLEKVLLRESGDILISPGVLQPDMLPKLHTLDLDFQMRYSVSESIPENMANRLVNLSANLSNVPDSFFTSGHLKNIRRLHTRIDSYERIRLLLEGIPNIERLSVTMFHTGIPMGRRGEEPGVLSLLCYFVKHNKSLTHLSLSQVPLRVEDTALENYALELSKLEFIHFPRPIITFDPWFRVIRSLSGTISLEQHLEESDEWVTHLWMGYDSDWTWA